MTMHVVLLCALYYNRGVMEKGAFRTHCSLHWVRGENPDGLYTTYSYSYSYLILILIIPHVIYQLLGLVKVKVGSWFK